MNRQILKQRLCEAVDRRRDEIEAFWKDLHEHPEHGYFEEHTSARLAEAWRRTGCDVTTGLARTGLRTTLNGAFEGPTVAVLGELDGVTCRAYQWADAESGASHTCGHDLQCTMVMALALIMGDCDAMRYLSGRLALFGVPAEEYIQIAERLELREQGHIAYLGGKQELIRLGAFDDVDMSILVHSGNYDHFAMPTGSNGFRAFTVQYQGRQAHAAAAPEEGINALYAAMNGIAAVNALRETFRDEDHVRVHFIITKGGDAVNSVPDDVRLEGYVRANNVACIDEVFHRVCQALLSGGDALGALATVRSIPGYLPLVMNEKLMQLFWRNAEQLPDEAVVDAGFCSASTDMGDLSHVMPTIHPYGGGTKGVYHSASYQVVDLDKALLDPIKALAMTIVDLLCDDALEARNVLDGYVPLLTKEQYIAKSDSWFFERQNSGARI